MLTEAVAALEPLSEPNSRLRAQAELALGQLLHETRRNGRAEAAGLLGVALLRSGEAERGRAMAEDSVARLADDPTRRQRITRALRTAR